MKIFAGIEGGASSSKLVLVNERGETLSETIGPPTNYLLIGNLDECNQRITSMIKEAKLHAGLSLDEPLSGLGLCLSGCHGLGCKRVSKSFLESYPDMTTLCVAANDLVGSMLTACIKGGFVLIAGTGSNCLLLNPDESQYTCGGFGYLLGDEGSAYWIALQACKAVLSDKDNFKNNGLKTSRLEQVIRKHFNIHGEDSHDDIRSLLIDYFYKPNQGMGFDKKKIASLSKELYLATSEESDSAINKIFTESGSELAQHIIALLPNVDSVLLNEDGGIHIVCVGAVFDSWNLLREGFIDTLSKHLDNFTLLRLRKSSSYGAAILVANEINVDLPLKGTTEILFQFKKMDTVSGDSSSNCLIS